MADYYLIRFLNGPLDKKDVVAAKDAWDWPLPEKLAVFAGADDNVGLMDGDDPLLGLADPGPTYCYRKVAESDLPQAADGHPGVARGAAYEVIP